MRSEKGKREGRLSLLPESESTEERGGPGGRGGRREGRGCRGVALRRLRPSAPWRIPLPPVDPSETQGKDRQLLLPHYLHPLGVLDFTLYPSTPLPGSPPSLLTLYPAVAPDCAFRPCVNSLSLHPKTRVVRNAQAGWRFFYVALPR